MKDYRREEAINKMVEVISLRKRIESLNDEIAELITVSEYKEPKYVKGLSVDKINYKIEPCKYGGTQLIFGDDYILLHSKGIDPSDTVFEHVFEEWKKK